MNMYEMGMRQMLCTSLRSEQNMKEKETKTLLTTQNTFHTFNYCFYSNHKINSVTQTKKETIANEFVTCYLIIICLVLRGFNLETLTGKTINVSFILAHLSLDSLLVNCY